MSQNIKGMYGPINSEKKITSINLSYLINTPIQTRANILRIGSPTLGLLYPV